MKTIINKLDKLVQTWANRHKSEISGQMGCVAHHIVGRANHYLRFDKDNLFICTTEEHNLIHAGILKIDAYVSPKRMGILREKRIESLSWKPNDDFYEKMLNFWEKRC